MHAGIGYATLARLELAALSIPDGAATLRGASSPTLTSVKFRARLGAFILPGDLSRPEICHPGPEGNDCPGYGMTFPRQSVAIPHYRSRAPDSARSKPRRANPVPANGDPESPNSNAIPRNDNGRAAKFPVI